MYEIDKYIHQMPKVELHVHLEGSIRPRTLLKLARKNGIDLPAIDLNGLRAWYQFTNFPHFIEVYLKISECIQTAEDLEIIAREFIENQAAQNILYTEVTYTAYTHYHQKGIPFEVQMEALNRARQWGIDEFGVVMNFVVDISREVPTEIGLITARWVAESDDFNIVGLGLGGLEVGHPPEKHIPSFEYARQRGVPSVPHAGETVGPESIWGAINTLDAVRIGHGVRCIEDPKLVETLSARQIPLEVCPTSNVCLNVFPDMEGHPLPQLVEKGLYVTINSDDPPLFNTSLTREYQLVNRIYGWGSGRLQSLVLNAANACLLPPAEKNDLKRRIDHGFAELSGMQTVR